MNVQAAIDAGVCGFHTTVAARSEDDQNVTFAIQSDCEKICMAAERLASLGSIDAYQEISPVKESQVLACCRETLRGCCSGCIVPTGIFKAMQVAAGLALPAPITIELTKVT